MPTVSVLLPVYNTKEEHLRASIESTLKQTWTDFEFLILDDASTDPKLCEVVMSYHDARIVFTRNEKNLGISLSRNILLDMAQGRYLAVMDHDDIMLPHRLERQVGFLDNHPSFGVVGSWSRHIPKGRIHRYPVENREIENTLMYGCVFEHPALMLRKDVLTDNNIRYEKEYTPAEDYVLLGRLLEKTEFMNLPEVLLLYRSHESNTSHVRSEQMETAKHKAMALIRQEHPSIWERAQREVTRWIIHKLFGFIPVMITEMCEDKTRYLLFGVLPLLITRRQGRKMRHSLFGVLPLLYSKKKEKLIDIV